MKKLRIGLLGYGRMGQMIEILAPQQGAEVVWKINSANRHTLDDALFQNVDVVIEMTRPDAALANVSLCLKHDTPVVTGTTGWHEDLPIAMALCNDRNGSMLYASNFSVGVNLFFALNKHLASMLAQIDQYKPTVTEEHHIHKKDKPSGTAVTIAEGIIQSHPDYHSWYLPEDEAFRDSGVIPVNAIRADETVGTHWVDWSSEVDQISIKHTAFKREGFALGAILAAKFIHDKKGIYHMDQVLGLR